MSDQTSLLQVANGADRVSNSSAEANGSIGRGIANGATAHDEANNLDVFHEPHDDYLIDLGHNPQDFIDADDSADPTTEGFNVPDGANQVQQESLIPKRQDETEGALDEASVTGKGVPSSAPQQVKRVCSLHKLTSTELTNCRSTVKFQPSSPLSRS